MSSPRNTGIYRAIPFAALTICLFAFFYGHMWLRVDPRLVYHAQAPIFMTDRAFFTEFLDRPGGLVEYLCDLLAQSYVYPWLGALIVTATSAFICLVLAGFVARLGGDGCSPLALLPAIPLVILHGQYDYLLATTVGFLITMLAANLYVRVLPRSAILRCALFVGLAMGLYYAVAGPYLLFVVLCVVFESLVRKRWVLAACVLVIGAALPYTAARYVFEVNVIDPYTHLLPLPVRGRLSVAGLSLCAVFPLIAIAVSLRRRAEMTVPPRPARREFTSRVTWFCGAAGVLVATVALGEWSFDRHEKALILVDHCARQGQWRAVLEHARRLPARRYRITTRWDVNRALFHTGRLGDQMFAYPQDPSSLLVSNADPDVQDLARPAWARLAEVFLELGRVAEAQFRTHEAMEHLGQRPEIIHQLFLIHMIQREADPARVALNALRRHLLWAGRAREYERRLANDPDLSIDAEVQRIRSVMMTEDHLGHVPVETMLRQLLARNPDNRMACEYLIGYYLLTRQLPEAAAQIRALAQRDGAELPRHYEEAILLHARAAGGSAADPSGPPISAQTRQRGEAFFRLYERHRTDKRAAEQALAPEFGDTYFFYGTFGETGYQYAFADRGPASGGRK